uniref:LIM zinc-binding domain-containing protein n=1 Tax=Timema monikensis TaxID=170555 RepID=A0A7R9E293_9NEOP|nr:unnamed protein product [Timema monikensis]
MNKKCARCEKTVYPIEELKCLDKIWHKQCFRCNECNMTLNMRTYKGFNKQPYCEATKASLMSSVPATRDHTPWTRNITAGSTSWRMEQSVGCDNFEKKKAGVQRGNEWFFFRNVQPERVFNQVNCVADTVMTGNFCSAKSESSKESDLFIGNNFFYERDTCLKGELLVKHYRIVLIKPNVAPVVLMHQSYLGYKVSSFIITGNKE